MEAKHPRYRANMLEGLLRANMLEGLMIMKTVLRHKQWHAWGLDSPTRVPLAPCAKR